MGQSRINVAIITNIITTYREGFYDRIFEREDLSVTIYCQDHIPGTNLKSIHSKYGNRVKIVRFISAKNEKIAWQFLPYHEILNKFDMIFVAGNPRVLSDVLFGTYLRWSKKKVVLWTMAHSYRDNKITEGIRLFWTRIFPLIFVYTDKEVEYLRNQGFKNNYILGMNNGLDQKRIDQTILFWTDIKLQEWRLSKGYEKKTIIVSSARLEPKNKFNLILKAIPQIAKEIPDILWCLIGSGAEEEGLKKMTLELGIEKHVSFVGAQYDEEKLAPYFLSSLLFIHPAGIGLGMMHAFGYGLPVIIHGQSNLHGPEYGAFTNGITGMNFIDNDVNSLSEVITKLIKSPDERNEMKDNVQKIAREQYNVDIMVERFVKMAKYAAEINN